MAAINATSCGCLRILNAITREQLRDAARFYLRKDQYARFMLLPATIK